MRIARGVLSAIAAVMLVFAGQAGPAGAVPQAGTVGPFDLTFYGNGDSDGTSTGQQDWTEQQKDDAAASVLSWSNRITNSPGRQIVVHLFWNYLGGGILGETYGPNYGNSTTSWTYPEHIWRDGATYAGPWASWDGSVRFDIGAGGVSGGWNFGAGTPGSQQIDFRSVVTHEIGHGVGFSATHYSGQGPGYDTWGGCLGTAASPFEFAGYLGLSRWDKNLMDKDGNRPLNGGTGTPGNFDECSDPAWFTGATATTYYGGNVPVYAPDPYGGGSSLSHLDESRIPNALMSPSIDPGQMARQPLRVEWEIMKDLGWSVLTTKTWTKGAGTLSWSDPANWGPDGTPDATWDVTFASSGLADGDTVGIVGNRSVNILTVDSAKSFTIGGSSGALTITKGNLTRTAGSSGAQTLARPVILGTNAVWDIGGTGQLSVTGAISGTSVGFEKRGAGVLVLSGANTYSGPTTVRGGILRLAGGSTGSSAFTVESGATLVSAATTFTMSCPLNNAGTVQVQAGKLTLGGGGTGTGAFSVASGATLVSASPTFAISGSLNNAGTVEVSGGTLTLSGPVAQRVGAALTGGTWRVGANSALNITTGSSITTNQGAVVLDGPASLFAKINSLADNQGMFSVQNGRDFATAGNFTNSGTLAVGAGSTLIVSGAYSQTGGTMTADGTFRVLGDLVNLLGGVMNADTDLGSAMEMDLTVNVTDATLNFGCNQHLDTLNIGHDGKVVFTGAQVVVLNHLVMGGVDLGATTLTPEPATLGLLGLGLAAALVRCRYRALQRSPRA